MRGPPSGIRPPLIPLFVLAIALAVIVARAATVDDFIGVHFESSTTIDKPADRFTVSILREGGLPMALDMEVRPIQGTFSVEYDNVLRVRYDDSQVKQGTPKVDTQLDWLFRSGSFGQARVRQGYRLIPIIEIDFDELYAETGWGAVSDSLPQPVAGSVLRRPAVATGDLTLHLFDSREIPTSGLNAVILGTTFDPMSGSFSYADSAIFATSFIPYPCIRVDLDLTARLDFKYTMRNTEVCVRYSSDPADSNCWAQTDSFTCISAFESVTIPIQIGCEEVRHKNIPFCPVTAQGEVDLQVKLTVEVDAYTVAYDCTDLPVTPPDVSTSTSSPVDTVMFDHTTTLKRADDDAILVVEVPFSQQEVTAPTENTTLYSGTATNIVWDPDLPTDLIACCSDSLLVDLYLAATDSTSGCEAVVIERTPNDGTYSWTPPPGLACSADGQAMFLTARFYCGGGGGDLVFSHAYSDSFYVQDTSGGTWR